MPYASRWSDFPEVEVLKNNRRISVAGLNLGINRIKWVHPQQTPIHRHDESEQVIIMVEGRIKMVIDDEEIMLGPDHICVIPVGSPHFGLTIGQDALFYEVFAPLRVQNLVGFLGKIF